MVTPTAIGSIRANCHVSKNAIAPGAINKPIDDHVARVYLAEDGASAVAWSVMSVGDVVVAIEYFGPSRPPEGFLGELESKLLLRLAPDVFTSDGGSSTDSSTTTTAAPAPGGSAPPTSAGSTWIHVKPGRSAA